MRYSALIPAAGNGSRMGLGYNKTYYRLKDGKTILEHALIPFQEDKECIEIIVVTDENLFKNNLTITNKISIVKGGQSREESVYNGLKKVKEDYVFIHDGARPYLTKELLTSLKNALEENDGALLLVPSKDTIKVVENGYVVKTLPRESLQSAQTPQAFKTSLLKSCMEKAILDHFQATDDASIVEAYSNTPIKAVLGSYENYKITTPEDISNN